ncbi:MAG: hypothetical protein ACLUW6_10095 [Coriobacteriaceae bacterium]
MRERRVMRWIMRELRDFQTLVVPGLRGRRFHRRPPFQEHLGWEAVSLGPSCIGNTGSSAP